MEDIARITGNDAAPVSAAPAQTAGVSPAEAPQDLAATQLAEPVAPVLAHGPRHFPQAGQDAIREAFESGRYPYSRPMGRVLRRLSRPSLKVRGFLVGPSRCDAKWFWFVTSCVGANAANR